MCTHLYYRYTPYKGPIDTLWSLSSIIIIHTCVLSSNLRVQVSTGFFVQHVYVSRVILISIRDIECIIWFISTGRWELPFAALGSCSTCTGLILVRTAASSGLLEGTYILSITAIKAHFQIIKKHYVRRCHCLCVAWAIIAHEYSIVVLLL